MPPVQLYATVYFSGTNMVTKHRCGDRRTRKNRRPPGRFCRICPNISVDSNPGGRFFSARAVKADRSLSDDNKDTDIDTLKHQIKGHGWDDSVTGLGHCPFRCSGGLWSCISTKPSG